MDFTLVENHDDHFNEMEMGNLCDSKNKLSLTKLDDVVNPNTWCYHSIAGRNIVRISTAAILSTAGAWLAGLLPTNEMIGVGGGICGIGNGASTWLGWESKIVHLIHSRMRADFPKIVKKTSQMSERIFSLVDTINAFENNKEAISLPDHFQEVEAISIQEKQQALPWICSTRNRRNCIRLFVAGGFSGAGGYWGGFDTSVTGVISGGILGGIGNALSTWLAYEQEHDEITKKRALDQLPKLVEMTEALEGRLETVVNFINILRPQLIVNHQSSFSPQSFLKEMDEEDAWICMETRERRNFVYVNVAGWMSAGGGWVSGYYPQPAGIVIGGTMGAVANAISTWLAWEKKHDKEIEKIAIHDFPQLVLKITEIYHLVSALESYVAVLAKESDKMSEDKEAYPSEELLLSADNVPVVIEEDG